MTIFRNKLVFNTFHWSGEQMILHPGIFKTKLDFNFNYTCIHSYKTPIIKQHLISDKISHNNETLEQTILNQPFWYKFNTELILIWIKTITDHHYITDLILALEYWTCCPIYCFCPLFFLPLALTFDLLLSLKLTLLVLISSLLSLYRVLSCVLGVTGGIFPRLLIHRMM